MEVAAAEAAAVPIAVPLTSLKQLESRTLLASSTYLQFATSSFPLSSSLKAPDRPRLLVCHDFKGGYQEDKWIQGCSFSEAYSLWHWHLIDVFVYFSHSLVTLPPQGWINAAHKHGVKVLGTFITEWKEGAQVCRELLASSESCQMYASRLAELAEVLGFDGWLLNVENVVAKGEIPRLHEFIQYLTECMHKQCPGSLVIWYDAVTEDGRLDWQNCLTVKNHKFFSDCDGLFTNYSWTKRYAKVSANEAGERAYDVYMGVDVFGRNTYGGGGFQSDVALKASLEAGVSSALFAPGWVYETKQPPDFKTAQNRWWGTIGQCWPIARLNPTILPFFSDFNQGCGRCVFLEGREVSNLPWFNLSCQNLQPLLHVLEEMKQSQHQSFQTSVSQEASAYSGGSCIRFSRSNVLSVVQLYSAHLPITGAPLHVSYSVVLGSDKPFCLAIRILKEDTWNILLLTTEQQSQERQNKEKLSVRKLLPSTFDGPSTSLVRSTSWTVHKYVVEVGPCSMRQIYAVIFPTHTIDEEKLSSVMEKNCQKIGNIKKVYPLHSCIEGTSGTGDDAPQVLLGHLRISMTEEHDNNLPSIVFEDCNPSWSQGSQGQKFVSLNLLWGLQTDDGFNSAKQGGCKWVQFHVYLCNNTIRGKDGQSVSNKTNTSGTDAKYLGVAMVKAFNVHMFPVPEASSSLQFCVQPQCACGLLQSFTNAPICTIKVPQD